MQYLPQWFGALLQTELGIPSAGHRVKVFVLLPATLPWKQSLRASVSVKLQREEVLAVHFLSRCLLYYMGLCTHKLFYLNYLNDL